MNDNRETQTPQISSAASSIRANQIARLVDAVRSRREAAPGTGEWLLHNCKVQQLTMIIDAQAKTDRIKLKLGLEL